jgi:L-asparagine oxygenase
MIFPSLSVIVIDQMSTSQYRDTDRRFHMSVRIYTPSDIEVHSLKNLVAEVKENLPPTEANVLARAALLAQELPRSLRTQMRDFSENETSDGLIVRTQDAFPNTYLPTPQDYDELNPAYLYNDVQIAHSLIASLIGTPVGFRSQRGGRCLNNIVPTKVLEGLPNSSSGSRFDFGLHTEDAYHPFKADFLALACIRNDEKAVTSFASIKSVSLPVSLRSALLKPQFWFFVDFTVIFTCSPCSYLISHNETVSAHGSW